MGLCDIGQMLTPPLIYLFPTVGLGYFRSVVDYQNFAILQHMRKTNILVWSIQIYAMALVFSVQTLDSRRY